MHKSIAAVGFTLLLVSLEGCATDILTSGRVIIGDDNFSISLGFSNRDRDVIRNYYARSHKQKKWKRTPPGLAKRGRNLPSGLAKRDTLPPGLQGRGLPSSLESRLSTLPGGYIRVVVGADIVIMNTKTRLVMDIYRDVVF